MAHLSDKDALESPIQLEGECFFFFWNKNKESKYSWSPEQNPQLKLACLDLAKLAKRYAVLFSPLEMQDQ